MGADYLTLVLHVLDDDPVLGVWCPTCLLPSAVTFQVGARCDHGWPQSCIFGSVTACVECHQMVPRMDLPPQHP